MDFYKFCQDYWVLEDTDEWWEEVTDKCDEFSEKYEKCIFGRGLADTLIRKLEEEKKGK